MPLLSHLDTARLKGPDHDTFEVCKRARAFCHKRTSRIIGVNVEYHAWLCITCSQLFAVTITVELPPEV